MSGTDLSSRKFANNKFDLPLLQQQVIGQACLLLRPPFLCAERLDCFRVDWRTCVRASSRSASALYAMLWPYRVTYMRSE